MVARYGRQVDAIVDYLRRPGGLEFVIAGEREVRGEFDYQRACEMALFPEDHWLRRTRLGLVRPTSVPDLSVRA